MSVATFGNSVEPRSFSIGPVKMQIMYITVGAADTAITLTADALSQIASFHLPGLQVSTASISGNTATITIIAPGNAVQGHVLVIGK